MYRIYTQKQCNSRRAANTCKNIGVSSTALWQYFICSSVRQTLETRFLTLVLYIYFNYLHLCTVGAVVQLVEYRTRNREVAGSTHTRSTASNLEQVANLLCAQASSASYPQWDGKWVVATATGWRPSVADWGDGDGVSASCTMDPIVH